MSEDDVSTDPPPQVKVAEYSDYDSVQAAVDKLSDDGFPVSKVAIVWSRLRQVEYVTGRRSAVTAARDGALSGIWFGALFGVLLTLFVELEEGTSALAVIISYAVVGAIVGALFVTLKHLSLRGRRDFTTSGRLDAEAYELWVNPEVADDARNRLGMHAGGGSAGSDAAV